MYIYIYIYIIGTQTCPAQTCLQQSATCVFEEDTPAEKKSCGKMSSQSTESGAGEQVLPQDGKAKARVRCVVCRHRHPSTRRSHHGKRRTLDRAERNLHPNSQASARGAPTPDASKCRRRHAEDQGLASLPRKKPLKAGPSSCPHPLTRAETRPLYTTA